MDFAVRQSKFDSKWFAKLARIASVKAVQVEVLTQPRNPEPESFPERIAKVFALV